MRKGNELNYWETLDRDADEQFEILTQKCLNKELSVDQMWTEMRKIQYDYIDSDICKETINKVFEFIDHYNLASPEEAEKSYNENYCDIKDQKDQGLTVLELFELLKKVIDDDKGDYKMKIDVNEYWVDLKGIQITDDVLNNEARTVNLF
jgi:hypothetical protein